MLPEPHADEICRNIVVLPQPLPPPRAPMRHCRGRQLSGGEGACEG